MRPTKLTPLMYNRVLKLPKMPKRTKEQKVVAKALSYIEAAGRASESARRNCCLNYAAGLLEALLMQDDEKEEE